MIDLQKIMSGNIKNLDISGDYVIDNELIKDSDIIELDKVIVNGKIFKDYEGNIKIDMKASSKMKIKDSVTLDDVWYDFSFDFNENIDEFMDSFIKKDPRHLYEVEL